MPRQHSRASERVRSTGGPPRSPLRVPGDHVREGGRDEEPPARASEYSARRKGEHVGVFVPPRGPGGPRDADGDPAGMRRWAGRFRKTVEHVRIGRRTDHGPPCHDDSHRPGRAVRGPFRQVSLHEGRSARTQRRPCRGCRKQPACGVRGGDVPALLDVRRSLDRELEHVERSRRRRQRRAGTLDGECGKTCHG